MNDRCTVSPADTVRAERAALCEEATARITQHAPAEHAAHQARFSGLESWLGDVERVWISALRFPGATSGCVPVSLAADRQTGEAELGDMRWRIRMAEVFTAERIGAEDDSIRLGRFASLANNAVLATLRDAVPQCDEVNQPWLTLEDGSECRCGLATLVFVSAVASYPPPPAGSHDVCPQCPQARYCEAVRDCLAVDFPELPSVPSLDVYPLFYRSEAECRGVPEEA